MTISGRVYGRGMYKNERRKENAGQRGVVKRERERKRVMMMGEREIEVRRKMREKGGKEGGGERERDQMATCTQV